MAEQIIQKDAIELYEHDAESGDAKAAFNLGWCLLRGSGIEQDKEKGIEWLQRDKQHALERKE